ncbi:MAG: hypothetical protein Q7V88_16995 [Actinomycetota bacterium]|nr:hypothetical protein [Actinomycetota bacterium]
MLAFGLTTVALGPAHAWADAAGPTDYRSQVVDVQPATPAVHLSVVGGDSFLQLSVDRGTEAEVVGYRGEPFIHFLPDGQVQENRASATYFLSASRYGNTLPAGFVDDAPADWHTVADDGTYAWHDHRIHWMIDTRPPGKQPGDVVLSAEVPLIVDGVEVDVKVESTWLPAASRLPMWLGLSAGVAVVGAVLAVAAAAAGPAAMRRRRARGIAGATSDLAVLAVVIGWWQYSSLPAETGPRPVWFALPAVAAVAGIAALVLALRNARPGAAAGGQVAATLAGSALVLLAGVNLVVWGWMRRDGFRFAILATDAPGWLDRFASAAALSGGALVAGYGLVVLAGAIVSPQQLLQRDDAAGATAT